MQDGYENRTAAGKAHPTTGLAGLAGLAAWICQPTCTWRSMATLQSTASTMLAYIEHGAQICAAGPGATPASQLLADGVSQWAHSGDHQQSHMSCYCNVPCWMGSLYTFVQHVSKGSEAVYVVCPTRGLHDHYDNLSMRNTLYVNRESSVEPGSLEAPDLIWGTRPTRVSCQTFSGACIDQTHPEG